MKNKKKLALIHTVGWYDKSVIQPFARQWQEENPDVEVINIMDDSLLSESLEHAGATNAVIRRLVHYIEGAEMAGANVAMVTCTTVGEASRLARRMVSIPVFNIDEPMAREAVRSGHRLGILATVPTSAPATRALLEAAAREEGKEIEIRTVINEEAFQNLLAGNVERHNELVAEEMDRLAEEVDVIVLGQISLAQIAHRPKVPVLQVGHSGFAEARRLLDEVGASEETGQGVGGSAAA